MSWRTNDSSVQGILVRNVNYDPNIELTPFIDTANVLVDQLVVDASIKGLSISDALLAKIETYLAAHFYLLADPMYQSKTTDGASGTFHGQTGQGFESTTYGQTAKRLDVTGILAGYDRTKHTVGMTWLGKPTSEMLSSSERNGE